MGGRFAGGPTLALALGLVAAALGARPALACSPAFNPTIAALGPEQVVLLGVTGDAVDGGRLFHVERAWNGDVPTSPIVIAFKEGEPVGDCSYPVAPGTRLVIAPWREPDGRLSADLGTLQADPRSEDGARYLAEAAQLYGEGAVPVAAAPVPVPSSGPGVLGIGAAVAIVAAVLVAGVLVRRRRAGPGQG
jgi:hypothetical protein